MQALRLGERIYFGGDRANDPHHGTVTEVLDDERGLRYQIIPDPRPHWSGPERYSEKLYIVDAYMISPVYLGHRGTQYVTEEAYIAWQRAQLAHAGEREEVHGGCHKEERHVHMDGTPRGK